MCWLKWCDRLLCCMLVLCCMKLIVCLWLMMCKCCFVLCVWLFIVMKYGCVCWLGCCWWGYVLCWWLWKLCCCNCLLLCLVMWLRWFWCLRVCVCCVMCWLLFVMWVCRRNLCVIWSWLNVYLVSGCVLCCGWCLMCSLIKSFLWCLLFVWRLVFGSCWCLVMLNGVSGLLMCWLVLCFWCGWFGRYVVVMVWCNCLCLILLRVRLCCVMWLVVYVRLLMIVRFGYGICCWLM